MDILIAEGAEIQVKDKEGRSPLDLASEHEHHDVMENLVRAAINQRQKKNVKAAPKKMGWVIFVTIVLVVAWYVRNGNAGFDEDNEVIEENL